METMIKLATEYGAQGILLMGVYALVKVVLYLNKQREAQEERYIVLIREQASMLAKILAHLEDEGHGE